MYATIILCITVKPYLITVVKLIQYANVSALEKNN